VSHLLRVALPDVPGSLGRVASAIGLAGGNIEAIEIVEHRADGVAVDDVFLTMTDGVMPDSVVSACTQLDGVEVVWIQRYGAGGGLFLDLELVEEMTQRRSDARNVLVDALPSTFRVDWAARLRPEGGRIGIVRGTTAAPESIPDDITWPETVTRGCGWRCPSRGAKSSRPAARSAPTATWSSSRAAAARPSSTPRSHGSPTCARWPTRSPPPTPEPAQISSSTNTGISRSVLFWYSP